jgi:hypothetical protein
MGCPLLVREWKVYEKSYVENAARSMSRSKAFDNTFAVEFGFKHWRDPV